MPPDEAAGMGSILLHIAVSDPVTLRWEQVPVVRPRARGPTI